MLYSSLFLDNETDQTAHRQHADFSKQQYQNDAAELFNPQTTALIRAFLPTYVHLPNRLPCLLIATSLMQRSLSMSLVLSVGGRSTLTLTEY